MGTTVALIVAAADQSAAIVDSNAAGVPAPFAMALSPTGQGPATHYGANAAGCSDTDAGNLGIYFTGPDARAAGRLWSSGPDNDADLGALFWALAAAHGLQRVAPSL